MSDEQDTPPKPPPVYYYEVELTCRRGQKGVSYASDSTINTLKLRFTFEEDAVAEYIGAARLLLADKNSGRPA